MFQVCGLHPKYSKLEESLRDDSRKWQNLTVGRVTVWCQDVDKGGAWREVPSGRRQPRASAASQEREDKGSAGGGGDRNNRGGGAPQRDAPKGPPRTKEEAEAQNDPFYVRGWITVQRIRNAIKRNKLCHICDGV